MSYQLNGKISIREFLNLALTNPVIDVRSPSEYTTGHIPGAHNIPLFDDIQRKEVGMRYKTEGRLKAILTGIDLCGPYFSLKLKNALEISDKGKVLIHCWRGGMRSEVMAWLFSLGGIEAEILEGGYKSYRHHILDTLSVKKRMIVLGGLTGSGKTNILNYLKLKNHQVIDLESLANHKGSAFGALGQSSQPSSEHFANLLYQEWIKIKDDQPLWIEDESRNIGLVFTPDSFYSNMQENPVIVLLMDVKTRLPRLLKEYSAYAGEDLINSVNKISKRLGWEKARDAVSAIEKGDYAKAIEILLDYYDKAYFHGLKKKPGNNISIIRTDTDDIECNVAKILEVASKISW